MSHYPTDKLFEREFYLLLAPGHDGEHPSAVGHNDSANSYGPWLFNKGDVPRWASDSSNYPVTSPTISEIEGHGAVLGAGDIEEWRAGPRFKCRMLKVRVVAIEEVPPALPPSPPRRDPELRRDPEVAKPKPRPWELPGSKINPDYIGVIEMEL